MNPIMYRMKHIALFLILIICTTLAQAKIKNNNYEKPYNSKPKLALKDGKQRLTKPVHKKKILKKKTIDPSLQAMNGPLYRSDRTKRTTPVYKPGSQ